MSSTAAARARRRSTPTRRAHAVLAAAALAAAPLLMLTPAHAAPGDEEGSSAVGPLGPRAASAVHLIGSLQTELGCAADWRANCGATALRPGAAPGTWERTFSVPAGTYEFRVAIDGRASEAVGVDGRHVPLHLEAPASLTFAFDESAGRLAVTTPDLAGARDRADSRIVAQAPRPTPGEVTYAVLVDRFADGDPANNDGGRGPDPLVSGYDPTRPDFFAGGDLRGVTQHLDYIAGLGVDAILLSPIFAGDAVRGTGAAATSGYHGQWGDDLARIDPRYGTDADLRALVDAAHLRGLAVRLEVPAGVGELAAQSARYLWMDEGVDGVRGALTPDAGVRDALGAWAAGRPGAGLRGAAGDRGLAVLEAPGQRADVALGDAGAGRLGHRLADAATVDARIARAGLALDLALLGHADVVLHHGDEQGLAGGPGHDFAAPMFATPAYTGQRDLAGAQLLAGDRFDTGAPLYRRIAALTGLRDRHPALADGSGVVTFEQSPGTGSLTFLDPYDRHDYRLVSDNAAGGGTAGFAAHGGPVERLYTGDAAGGRGADGVVATTYTSRPLTTDLYRSVEPLPVAEGVRLHHLTVTPGATANTLTVDRYAWPALVSEFTPVSFAVRPVGTADWRPLGTRTGTSPRLTHRTDGFAPGTALEYRAVLRAGTSPDGLQFGESAVGASVVALAGVDLGAVRSVEPIPAPDPDPTPTPDPTPEPTPTPSPTDDEDVKPAGPPNVFLSTTNATPDLSFHVPARGAVFFGDWDGDGVDTPAWRAGNRFTFAPANADVAAGAAGLRVMDYGRPDDEVFVGDWDGDGSDTIGLRRATTFHLSNSFAGGPADHTTDYGRPADRILITDIDGDGTDTPSVRRGNEYHLKFDLTGGPADVVTHYGRPDDVALVGDPGGNGSDTISVRRGTRFHLKFDLTGGAADLEADLGRPTDVPVLGTWTRGGRDTIGVYRP